MCERGQVFGDVLAVLSEDRRAHSVEVGRKAASMAQLVPASLRSDLVAAATLHDIGYGHVDTEFHALDGASFLAGEGFSAVICSLVLEHSASRYEAETRGFDLAVYERFRVTSDLSALHSVIAWADMTTGPTGLTVTVEERLDEICARYGPGDLVTRFIDRARPVLLAAGQSPTSSIHGLV